MNIKQWITTNIADFNNTIKTEEDLKVKVLLPYLRTLGYSDSEFRFEHGIDVAIGTKKTTVFSDVEITINGRIEIVIDTKSPSKSISEKDVLQSASYAKLVDTPPALYGITTNGLECAVTNVYTGKRSMDIPTRQQLLRDIDKAKKKPLQDIEIREVESILFTLHNTKELYKVIQDSKDVIEKRGLIRSDQSFREMTKIILIKMNEERRVKAKEGSNRFLFTYLTSAAKANETDELAIFKELFEEAKNKYPSIYTNENESIQITDNACILDIVKKLEPFSFIGTGDDIKGTVYEVFLKSTLRGEFDQYFTPRELVDFMVKSADPDIGDVILDPACGSGGFLIQAFSYVNKKINESGSSEIENNNKFNALIDKCLWGHEADYDLHVLAKINLIMHGDGWNNIYQGDTLQSNKLPDNHFDLVLANPPFTIPYTFSDVLSQYELGVGKASEELDILFVEKSLKALKPGNDLYIVLPEGLLNIKKYAYFREWLMQKADLLMSVSLPEGAFIPFGGSVSKTCILGVRKKGLPEDNYIPPKYVFLGKAVEVGYETGKKAYVPNDKNDLEEMTYYLAEIFEGVKQTSNGGECGWIEQEDITSYRIDASYLLNKIDRKNLMEKFPTLVPLGKVCKVCNESVTVLPGQIYNYLEVPDISETTGVITNIRKLKGAELNQSSFHKFYPGDILFTRINPRKNRIAIAPPIDDYGLVSKEVYRLEMISNPYIQRDNRYVLCTILQSEHVKNQIIRLSTGSSSSRARVQEEDLLADVYIPIPEEELQARISKSTENATMEIWDCSQKYLKIYT
ncbi:MAG: N-6 DNA methylase, partial [Clostridia bacterium]|nr:N-6 DNA methylase [Clostridia bacterium]